jgi:multimeric flavodoxin WrbA
MKVFALQGSPRRDGTTAYVLSVFLEVLASLGFEVESLNIDSLKIEPCNECLSCYIREGCIISDSMNVIYRRLEEADIIIFATPVFFSGPTAQLKAAIDRLQAFWAKKNILGRKVREKFGRMFGIVVGSRNSEIDLRNTVSIFKAAASAIDVEYSGTFSILDAENKECLPPKPLLKKSIEGFLKEKLELNHG